MNNQLLHNHLPPLLAALLTEQGTHQAEDITIRPAEGQPGMALREVLNTKRNPKDGSLSILVSSKSEERLAMEQELPQDHELRALVTIFEREMTLLQIERMLQERMHLLGLSPLQPAFFPETQGWDGALQKILAFFLPYRSQIRGDLVLMEKCFGAALQQPVQVTMTKSKQLTVAGVEMDNNNVNLSCLAGGVIVASAPCVRVQVGPMPLEDLKDFVPGSRKRRLLEEALLVHFLPHDWDWVTEITVAEIHQKFQIAEEEIPLRIDIQSFIVS